VHPAFQKHLKGGKMSSAFPQTQQTVDPFSPGAAAILVKERGTIIPSWYVRNPHRDPNLVVKRGGLPLLGMDKEPFTISQVAPERRWAVDEDGELMNQTDFDAAKKKTIFEFYETLQANGHPDARYVGNVDREPIPDVAYFVSWRIDPEDPTKLLEIGFDPNKKPGDVPKRYHTSDGDVIDASRMDVLCKSYHDPALRSKLTPEEIAEVEQSLGVKASDGGSAIAAKLEQLTELRASGALSDEDYIANVAKLTGTGAPTEPPAKTNGAAAPAEDEPAVLAACGKAGLKVPNGLAAHERRCTKCRATRGLGPWEKGCKD